MKTHPLVRKTIAALPLPGPFRQSVSAPIALDHNLTPGSGPWHWYPELLQNDLVEGVLHIWSQIESNKGSALRLSSENILLTHGGVDALSIALSIFCEPGVDQVTITPPSFEAFPHWATIQGLTVAHANQEDWSAVIESKSKALLLCSPNNPLGYMTSTDSLRTLLLHYPGIVIVDEAYADFSTKPSCMSLVNEFQNLVVLRTLSKSIGLAGLRVGALVAHPCTISAAMRVQVPFCVSTPVRSALLQTFNESTSVHAGIDRVRRERERVALCLRSSPHVRSVKPSDANFLCVSWVKSEVARALLVESGIRVRDYGEFSRITIGSERHNDALLAALQAQAGSVNLVGMCQ